MPKKKYFYVCIEEMRRLRMTVEGFTAGMIQLFLEISVNMSRGGVVVR